MEEFNLSDKRCVDADMMYPNVVYSEQDVKEFIKKLKEEVGKLNREIHFQEYILVYRIIDKLAGDKLI